MLQGSSAVIGQMSGLPLSQTPPWQESFGLHALPSLQGTPSATGIQVPVATADGAFAAGDRRPLDAVALAIADLVAVALEEVAHGVPASFRVVVQPVAGSQTAMTQGMPTSGQMASAVQTPPWQASSACRRCRRCRTCRQKCSRTHTPFVHVAAWQSLLGIGQVAAAHALRGGRGRGRRWRGSRRGRGGVGVSWARAWSVVAAWSSRPPSRPSTSPAAYSENCHCRRRSTRSRSGICRGCSCTRRCRMRPVPWLAEPDGTEVGRRRRPLHGGAPGDAVRQAFGQVVEAPIVHALSSERCTQRSPVCAVRFTGQAQTQPRFPGRTRPRRAKIMSCRVFTL